MAYLDNNATAPLRPLAFSRMTQALQDVGNPSSVHSHGRTMRKYIEDARNDISTLCGCAPEHIIFTSGGTEAIAMVMCFFKNDTVLITSVEHNAVRENALHAPHIPVDEHGIIDLSAAEDLIIEHKPKLISILYANNETGVIQPVKALVELAHKYDALIHVDAVQAAGKIPLDFNGMGADYMSIAAHKIGGPQGVGALIKASGRPLPRLICGGTQERHQRAGTENVAGIAGFGGAAFECLDTMKDLNRLKSLRDDMEAHIKATTNSVRIWGEGANRVPNTTMLTLPNIASETIVMIMDLNGVAIGSGSACSSGTVKPSRILMSMGCDEEEAKCCIRISLGWKTSQEDVEKFKNSWTDMVEKIRHKIKPV